jgi:2-oxo-3-hexenedioate decarboxylase
VFGFARTPDPALDEAALIASLAWVAHGVEIMHTHDDGWRFGAAADPVADFGLHGRLVLGPRRASGDWAARGVELAALPLELYQADRLIGRETWTTRPGDARLPGLVLHFRP